MSDDLDEGFKGAVAALAMLPSITHGADLNPDISQFGLSDVVKRQVVNTNHIQRHSNLRSELFKLHKKYSQLPYEYDKYNVWQTREETEMVGSGDCKAVSIAEYYDLLELGLKDDQLMLVTVYITSKKLYHMFLVVDKKYVLDIREKTVIQLNDISKDYKPVYMINRQGWKKISSFSNINEQKSI